MWWPWEATAKKESFVRGSEIEKFVHAIWVAPLLIGFGAIVENSGRPGSLAVSHMFYGWGVIWAIGWHAFMGAFLKDE
jgi:hypothetical protein